MVDVLVYGSASLDIVIEYDREYSFAGNNLYHGATCYGGGGANVAYYLALQGISTGLVAPLGRDPLGEVLLQRLRDRGIVYYGPRVEAPSSVIVALVHPGGERSFLVIREALGSISLGEALEALRRARPRIVFLHGYWLEIPELSRIVVGVAREAKERGLTVAFDPGAYNIVEENRELIAGEILPYTDIVLPNTLEAKALTGADDPSTAAEMIAMRGPGIVAVKMGKRGAVAYTRGRFYYAEPVEPRRMVNTLGAGDAFDAGLLYGILSGRDIGGALREANRVASLALGCVCAQCER